MCLRRYTVYALSTLFALFHLLFIFHSFAVHFQFSPSYPLFLQSPTVGGGGSLNVHMHEIFIVSF
jgi:hypothetical protein